jgi:hypothetical protein
VDTALKQFMSFDLLMEFMNGLINANFKPDAALL